MKRKWLLKMAAAILPVLAASASTAEAATLAPYGLAVDARNGVLYIADPTKGVLAYNPASNAIAPFAPDLSNAFSVAVNSNGLVYVGVVGASAKINVYNAQGAALDALPVPRGDSPITLAFDADNILYESNGYSATGWGEINAFTNDLSLPYDKQFSTLNPSIVLTLPAYNGLPTYTEMKPDSKFALAYDNGQIFLLGSNPGQGGNANIYDTQLLLSGHARDFREQIAPCIDPRCNNWLTTHVLPFSGFSFAAAVDGNHNIFYSDPDGKAVRVTAKGGAPRTLLSNLGSSPSGIAFDKARSRLYVAFPSDHQILAYAVTYATQNGVKIPSLSMPPAIIR